MPKYIEELVSQQVHKSELARQQRLESGKPCPNPVITISRRMGSGARIVAGRLSQELGWALWDKDILDAMAEDASVSRKIVEEFDEHTKSEIELFARAALGEHDVGGFIYVRHLAHAVAAIAKLGNAIILGRGANFLLPRALNIRIDASDDHRIANMMNYENLTREQAEAKIRQSDRDREHFLIQAFGKERVASAHYDLTIWMDEFTNDGAVDIIKAAIKAKCAHKS
jgi:cytidylate kinase